MKDKRSKLQIYYDIFDAIIQDKQDHEEISKTRIQFKSNTSYDKLLRYLGEMDQKGIIRKGKQIEVTDIGMQFYNDYSRVNNLINEITQRLS
jgi:predicted transcriptional regulator